MKKQAFQDCELQHLLLPILIAEVLSTDQNMVCKSHKPRHTWSL